MTPTNRMIESPGTPSNLLTATGARRAAALASNVAGVVAQWAELRKTGHEAVAEAMEGAERARLMADCAAVATSESTIQALATDAWAAAQRVIDADRRMTIAIEATSL